jgi:hypothetical protein
MKGRRLDRCAICGARGSGYRRVPYPFRETGLSEEHGVILLVAFFKIYAPGAVCWQHNYQRADPEPEQLSLLGGNDESLPSAGAV